MKVVSVKFKENGRAYYFDPGEFKIKEGDFVVVTTARGTECGEVVRAAHEVPGFSREVKPVIRVADAVDVRRMRQNRADVQQAYHICEQRIAAHNLKMKLVDAEYTLDRSKLVFYFTADNRVDFRELVKDLASQFHTRIELRQIGVRDESKMLGGLGLCGQPFCCSRFLKNFQPVSIKMAKEQGLSLNPAKISGSCGRLMCCLAYEQKSYEYLNSITPQVGSIVRTPDGEGTVIEVNVVAGTLKVRSNVEILAPRIYKRDECVYVRGGKRTPLPAMNPIINRKQDILYKDLAVDLTAHRVSRAGHELLLTPREFALLAVLVTNCDTALSRSQLLEAAWGYAFIGESRTVDVHINRLRRKLGLQNDIQTVYKVGYRLNSAN